LSALNQSRRESKDLRFPPEPLQISKKDSNLREQTNPPKVLRSGTTVEATAWPERVRARERVEWRLQPVEKTPARNRVPMAPAFGVMGWRSSFLAAAGRRGGAPTAAAGSWQDA